MLSGFIWAINCPWKLRVTFYVVKVTHKFQRWVDGSNESLYYPDEELDHKHLWRKVLKKSMWKGKGNCIKHDTLNARQFKKLSTVCLVELDVGTVGRVVPDREHFADQRIGGLEVEGFSLWNQDLDVRVASGQVVLEHDVKHQVVVTLGPTPAPVIICVPHSLIWHLSVQTMALI